MRVSWADYELDLNPAHIPGCAETMGFFKRIVAWLASVAAVFYLHKCISQHFTRLMSGTRGSQLPFVQSGGAIPLVDIALAGPALS